MPCCAAAVEDGVGPAVDVDEEVRLRGTVGVGADADVGIFAYV